MDKVFLSYNDSIIYESDLKLLDTNNWLNDRLIGFVYEYLEKETFNSECNQKNYFAFVNPSTVQYLKLCSSLDEAKMCFLDPLELDKKDIIFLPLNDNQNEESAGGSHWSLLVIDRKKLGCMHFDSTGSNHKEAQYFYNKYKSYFGVNKFEVSTNFPKQTNSSDCGVYALGKILIYFD